MGNFNFLTRKQDVSLPFSLEYCPLLTEQGFYYLLCLQEAGFCEGSINGPIPFTWKELKEYAFAHGGLEKWEIRFLRELSVAYVSGHLDGKSDKAGLKSPYERYHEMY